MSTTAIGEVVHATSVRFVGQSPSELLYQPPPLGSLVKVSPRFKAAASVETVDREIDPFEAALSDLGSDMHSFQNSPLDFGSGFRGIAGTVYGVVTLTQTSGINPLRKPAAYGMDEDRLEVEQPQIHFLLSTTYNVLIVGHVGKSGKITTNLPPIPVRLHAPVVSCSADEVIALTDGGQFVRRLLDPEEGLSADDLVVAALNCAQQTWGGDDAFLIRAGKELAVLLKDEPIRLQGILERLEF